LDLLNPATGRGGTASRSCVSNHGRDARNSDFGRIQLEHLPYDLFALDARL
jgi:hypothetical protein